MEATRAGDLNREKTAAMKFLCAKILLVQGKDSEAEQAFQSFIKDFPNDAAIPDARKYLDQVEEEKKSVAAAAFLCPRLCRRRKRNPLRLLCQRLRSIGRRQTLTPQFLLRLLASLVRWKAFSIMPNNKFSSSWRTWKNSARLKRWSTRCSVRQEIGADPVSREFAYLIFVHHSQKFPYYFLEDRNGGEAGDSFPSALATRGLLTLGFMIINPAFSKDFDFTCEGLGTLNGKPAWQLHFVQKADIPSHVSSYYYKKATYQIPLKGRVWIGANNYNILRLETTLREPVAGLRLNREQLTVELRASPLSDRPTELWLPSQGEMYLRFDGSSLPPQTYLVELHAVRR